MILPARGGTRPRTNYAVPHSQLDQNAPVAMQDALLERVRQLPWTTFGVSFAESSGNTFLLEPGAARGPRDLEFLHGLEFGHLHRDPGDGALHLPCRRRRWPSWMPAPGASAIRWRDSRSRTRLPHAVAVC